MGKVAYWIVVLALAAGAARLGVGLPPLDPAQFRPWEVVTLASLVALPVLLGGFVVARLVWSRSALLVRAFQGLPMKIAGTDATGTIDGVPMRVTFAFVEAPDGKRTLRWCVSARELLNSPEAQVILLAKRRPALPFEGFVEIDATALEDGADLFRAWRRPEKGTPFRDAPRLPDRVDAGWLALARKADADEIRFGASAATLLLAPNTLPEAMRAALVAARSAVEPAARALPSLDDELPPARSRGLPSILAAGVAVASIVGYALVSPSNAGFEADALALARACPAAVEPLGGAVERRTVGFQTSSTKGKESRGNKWWLEDILVQGPKASGRIDAVATRLGRDGWLMLRADLLVGGKRIDLLRCGEVEPKWGREVDLEMTVVETSGVAPTGVGDACRVRSKAGSNDFNCRFEIGCTARPSTATAMLYGATDRLGFTLCGPIRAASGKTGLVAEDTDPSMQHEEPKLRFDEPAGTAELEAPDGTWRVRLERQAR